MGTIYLNSWQEAIVTEWRWPHFLPQELACKGSGKLIVETELLDKLEDLRARLKRPLIVTSCYRTPEHNRSVGGAKDSQHLLGKAADISMVNHDPKEFIRAAKLVGFRGIGSYPKMNMVHVDIRDMAAQWGDPWSATPVLVPSEIPMGGTEPLATKPEVRGALNATLFTVGAGAVAQAADWPTEYFFAAGFAVVAALVAVAVVRGVR